MSPKLVNRDELIANILKIALNSNGITIQVLADKIDSNYTTTLGLLTELCAKGCFKVIVAEETRHRTFVPVKERIKEMVDNASARS